MNMLFGPATLYILRYVVFIFTPAKAFAAKDMLIPKNDLDHRLIPRGDQDQAERLIKTLNKAEWVVMRMQHFLYWDRFDAGGFQASIHEIEISMFEVDIMSHKLTSSRRLSDVVFFAGTLFNVLRDATHDLKLIPRKFSCCVIIRNVISFYAGLFGLFSIRGYPKFDEAGYAKSVMRLANIFEYFEDLYGEVQRIDEVNCTFHHKFIVYQQAARHTLELLASHIEGVHPALSNSKSLS